MEIDGGPGTSVLVGAILLALAMLLVLALRPQATRQPAGRVLAFLALFGLPTLGLALGLEAHVERAKQRTFCLSCHVMEPYGKSLYVDDEEFVPANHFQNARVSRDQACYTCHTDYGPFGGVKAKLRGLRHLYVQYLGTIPDTIHTYEPYNNRECLHCHGSSRAFIGVGAHNDPDTTMASMRANRTSCLTSGCHDVIHNVNELADAPFWKEPRP